MSNEKFDRKQHWENIYQSKAPENLSWYQATPIESASYIKQFDLPKSANIIDVGSATAFLPNILLT